MHWFRLALIPAAVALAVAAEWTSYEVGQFGLVVADGVVGVILVVCGVLAWELRPVSRSGPLMVLAGFTWFAGNFAAAALFWHRGPLVHLHISYPTGRLRRRLAVATVGVAYADALVAPWARNAAVTVGLAGLVALASVDVFVRTSGPARRAGLPALTAALAYASVLAASSVGRLAGWGTSNATLLLYGGVVASVAVVLLVDLLFGRWTEQTVADLVVRLGERRETGSLRDQLARALGDPSLVVGYWIAEQARYIDDAGHPVVLPSAGSGRAVTEIGESGNRVAVLVHDAVAVDDPQLVDGVAAAARLAVGNARLQAEVRSRVTEVAASRRRIVEAGDAQRRRFELELWQGAGRRLESVARLLDEAAGHASGPATMGLRQAQAELDGAQTELRDFAQGIRPSALAEGGLAAALPVLAERAPVPIELAVSVGRLPPAVEAAMYFVCAEALTNVVKHAGASHVLVDLALHDDDVVARIGDDGVGGADPTRGSGLSGLADRVEALGGRLRVGDSMGGGTWVTAAIPIDGSTRS